MPVESAFVGPEGEMDESSIDMDSWLSRLPPETRAAILALPAAQQPAIQSLLRDQVDELAFKVAELRGDPVQIDPAKHRFIVVESGAYDPPVLRIYRRAADIARRLGQLADVDDMFVWVCYGEVMPFTKGPQRYLLMPNSEYALSIPNPYNPEVRLVATAKINAEIEESGYVGPAGWGPEEIDEGHATPHHQHQAPESAQDTAADSNVMAEVPPTIRRHDV